MAIAGLEAALSSLPAEKHNWKPSEVSRSASNQVAECAIMNGVMEDMIPTRMWPQNLSFEQFEKDQTELSQDEQRAISLLRENTARVLELLGSIPDDDLQNKIEMPRGMQTRRCRVAWTDTDMCYRVYSEATV